MKRKALWLVFLVLVVVSCGPRNSPGSDEKRITVTIPPFAWFVEQIGGDDFVVNVLLPPGADHHIWEPLPAQISALAGSEAFIINGQLGFEHAWMDRFMQVNPEMEVLNLSRNIELLGSRDPSGIGVAAPLNAEYHSESPDTLFAGLRPSGSQSEGLKSESLKSDSLRSEGLRSEVPEEGHENGGGDHSGHAHDDEADDHAHDDPSAADDSHGHVHGGPDPHYWMSPSAARIMAKDVHDFLAGLNPVSADKYDENLAAVNRKIAEVDSLVRVALGSGPHPAVLIYHPALAYMGRDYGFEQISFEDEGKNPSPARMKELIDLARDKEIKIVFIQAEYDVRNAESLSRETGAKLVVINPMNRDWPEAVIEVANVLGSSNRQ